MIYKIQVIFKAYKNIVVINIYIYEVSVSVKIYIFFISIHKNSNVLLNDNIHKYIYQKKVRFGLRNDEEKIYYFQ